MQLITEILAANARNFPDGLALVERIPETGKRTHLTWAEFYKESLRLSRALRLRGYSRGEKVVHLMTNCLEWLPYYFGILDSGAWAVPLNFRFLADKILRCTLQAEARVMIFGPEFVDRIRAVKPELDTVVELYVFSGPEEMRPRFAMPMQALLAEGDGEAAGRLRPVPLEPDDEAALYFTSGTTGDPKGVLLTHGNLAFACEVEHRHHQQTSEDVFLCIPPLYHTGAKMHWFGSFKVAAPSVLLKGVSPRWILEAVSEEKASIVWLLVPWAHDILHAIESGELKLEDYDLSRWRLMHIGAQPVPPSLVQRWRRIFPHHAYDTNYGLTEATGPGCVHLGMENIHKVGAIGIPGWGWECRIVDRKMEDVPFGEPGELLVRGGGMMREYYRNPKETGKSIKNGWLCTGDIARQDKDGFYWLLDRKKDLVITGGENVYPVEVENYLIRHEKIQDVAIIGTPDERLGELVTAVIQVKPGMEMGEEEVRSYCLGMPRYRRPRIVHFGEVPRNPTGKIEKPLLRKRYAGIYSSFRRD
ncbi:class I adenylate-forming enzyme family protein [Desulfobotulus sp.]|jgi:acyl-CoA synthetase (AMP-forming)/AMP-acid ligase II|uniref:class I adenylate-forming enzyme family protein n=1 Tax=Desulfobotulus sp. TaxID=1940337 RepID=UPI002A3621AA|nr:class I adenylate-forming enzyme family protein [Desulfobotulus sp.]MDY0162297.1 class I adenylate-forming enzyme family protein [Desulfobotulus sp.]